jgi:hypothetical protein
MNSSRFAWIGPGWLRSWERFWFTPRSPTLLGLIRICCGLLTFYTLGAYSFQLQDFLGPHGWVDVKVRSDIAHNRPVLVQPLLGDDGVARARPTNEAEKAYVASYKVKFGVAPRPPFPRTEEESKYIDDYRLTFGFDLRLYGLRPPADEREREYLERYTREWRSPPSAYPSTEEEEKAIDEYIARQGADPHRVYARGAPLWSFWFHLADPTAMAVVHGLVLAIAFFFTIGFCTRIASALTWFAVLCYIHRNTSIQFGVDTMMVILVTYLTIGPSGAALSVDRLLARWWSRAKPAVIGRWFRLLGRAAPSASEIVPAAYSARPEPSVSANFALRLLQIHVCIIYLASGLSKLQGNAWWDGTAVWNVLANPEFAPMHLDIYNAALRWLAGTALPLYAFLNIATLFTLFFEVSYAFLIWRPATRWLVLGSALTLHGLIGLFMGLKTFSLIMLVMNMAFLNEREVEWLLSWFLPAPPRSTEPSVGARPQAEAGAVAAVTSAAAGR